MNKTTLILDVHETGECHIGEGKTFGFAAYELIEKIRLCYGLESLDEGYLFEALTEVLKADDGVYKHFDMSVPETNFTLTMVVS